jgi:hypothetical protein
MEGDTRVSAEKKQECTVGEKVHQMGMKRQRLPIHLGVNANLTRLLMALANNGIGQTCGTNCISHTSAQNEPSRLLVVYLFFFLFLVLAIYCYIATST